MDEKHKGILIFAAAILSISLLFGAVGAKAADGGLNAAGIVLKDTNANGKIDQVQITVDYAAGTANAIVNATDLAMAISKFTVTDTITGNPVTVSSINFVSGNGAVAVFNLFLNEADADLSVNTSATALNVLYDATNSDLKITNGTTPVAVAAIASSVVEKDGARPIILTAVDQSNINLDGGTNISANANIVLNFSEPMDTTSLDAASEWTISPDPGTWALPVWSNSNKTVTLTHTTAFATGSVETVNLFAPLAVSGFSSGDLSLQKTPIAAAVNDPFSFTVAGTVTPIPTPTPTPIPSTAVSPYWSTVNASPVVLIADGTQATVTVVVKNSVSAILSGKVVTISSSRGLSDTITPASITTDANGIASFKVSSLVVGKSIITAVADGVTISQTAAINFLPVGSTIGNPTTPNDNSGVILYRIPGDSRVYVIKNNKKHWIKNEKEFNDNGYSWKNIQDVSAAILAKYPDAEQAITELLRAIGDAKVYAVTGGKKQWIKTADEFNAAGYDWSNIQNVTPDILATYSDAQLADALVKIVNAMNLRVRNTNSTTGAVLDTVKQNEVYQVVEKKNGWYKIKTKKGKEGWISGKYANEQ